MKWLDKTTRKIIIIGSLATIVPFAPLVVSAFIRSHRLSAVSKSELFNTVYRKDGNAIDQEVRNQTSRGKTYDEMLAHWQVLKRDLVRLGATENLATRIINSLQVSVKGTGGALPRAHWPVMVRSGWILNQPVWMVVTGYPNYLKSPLRASQLKVPLTRSTRQSGWWNYQISLFDLDGNDITQS